MCGDQHRSGLAEFMYVCGLGSFVERTWRSDVRESIKEGQQ